MDERKQQVLRAIVTLYTNDGEPIGSHLLSEYMDLAVSTATLRNEMAALTRLGLLEQPHTSAGRVPSGAGYRYYIDHLMHTAALTPRQTAEIDACFATFDYDPPRLVAQAAKALSEQTGLMVAATTPRAEDIRIAHFQITQVGRCTAAVLAVTSAGGVLTRVARTDADLTEEDIRTVTVLVNRALAFLTPVDVNPAILQGLQLAFGERSGALMPVARAAALLVQEAGSAVTAVEGIANLLPYPETSTQLAKLLEFSSDHLQLARSIIPANDRLTVTLGSDEGASLPNGVAVMSRRYMAGNGLRGGMAIIGPDRMPYGKLCPILEYYTLRLGQAMSGSRRHEQ